MRQETGSNQPKATISISVRLMSSGDHFLIDNYLPHKTKTDGRYLRVELLTKRSLLIPKEQYENNSADSELAAVGLYANKDEEIITIEDRDLVALIIAPKSMTSRLDELYCGRYEFTTPLLRRPISADAHVILDICNNLATVKIYNSGWALRFVDIYEVPSTASLVYWIQRLSQILGLNSYTLYIYRYEVALERLLNKNFKKIMYANNKRSI